MRFVQILFITPMAKRNAEIVSIVPDPSLMEDIGAASYTVYQALNELLANTFDARIASQPIRADIDIDPGKSIQLGDDACGMDKDTLIKALTLAYKMDRDKGVRKRKGMYGLGMKTAASSLGRKWEIWTRSAEDKCDYYALVDLAGFREAKAKWELEIETLDRKTPSPLGSRKSGTVIRVTQVKDKDPDVSVLEKQIGSAYRVEIQKFQDQIFIGGNPIEVGDPNIVEGSKKEIRFTLKCKGKQHEVTGWWGRLPKYMNDGNYGFNLYREGQLVESNFKSPWFNPHNTVSNFTGELTLDFIEPNYHKKGFDTQQEEWKALCIEMRKQMEPIMSEVRKFKAGDVRRGSSGAGAKAGAVRAIQTAPGELNEPEETAAPPSLSVAETQPAAIASEGLDWKKITGAGGDPFFLTYELIPMSSDTTSWTYLPPDEDATLLVKINVESVLYSKCTDPTTFAMLAVADCLCQYLQEKRKLDPRKVREMRDQWLKRAAQTKFTALKHVA